MLACIWRISARQGEDVETPQLFHFTNFKIFIPINEFRSFQWMNFVHSINVDTYEDKHGQIHKLESSNTSRSTDEIKFSSGVNIWWWEEISVHSRELMNKIRLWWHSKLYPNLKGLENKTLNHDGWRSSSNASEKRIIKKFTSIKFLKSYKQNLILGPNQLARISLQYSKGL